MINDAKAILHQQFKLKNLGDLKYFWGIEVLRCSNGFTLNQRKYILELIADTSLAGANQTLTPLETNARLTLVVVDKVTGVIEDIKDVTSYQRLIRKLMYATLTRPAISYAVKTLS